jgi:hypothetical protein
MKKEVALILFLLPAPFAQTAFAEGSCRDTIVVLSDDNPTVSDGQQAPRVTMVLDCLASSQNFPEQTTLNYFTYSAGKFCQSSRVCGNVRTWRGDFRIGAKYYFSQSLVPDTSTSMGDCNGSSSGSSGSSGGGNGNPNSNPYGGYWWDHPVFCDSGMSNVYAEFKIGYENIKRDCSNVEEWICLDVPHP